MKSLVTTICLSLTLILGASGLAGATLLNGDFSSGLASWEYGGSVTGTTTGEATFSDNNIYYYSFLYQQANFAPGSYTLEFDYQIQMLGSASSGTFNDLFSASLYFANDTTSINLQDPHYPIFPNSAISIGLFSKDNNGGNTGWQHYSITFSNADSYIIPTFELLDLNYIDNDSSVLIDNVSITESAPVPEPATLLLFGGGLLGLFGIRRIRSRGNV